MKSRRGRREELSNGKGTAHEPHIESEEHAEYIPGYRRCVYRSSTARAGPVPLEPANSNWGARVLANECAGIRNDYSKACLAGSWPTLPT